MSVPSPAGILLRVQVGEAMPFAREQASAINKFVVDGPVQVGSLGLAGDEQADTFFHGGALQAVHNMPQTVYTLLREHYPDLTIHDGMLGENITISDQIEDNVCIGDQYQLGSVVLQVTRPRRPCWKIDSQLGRSGIARFLQLRGQVGWYYRVLQTGSFQCGDACTLLERPYPDATLAALWAIYNDNRQRSPASIQYWLGVGPLERSFKEKLARRLN